MEKKQIKITQSFLIILKIFIDQKRSEASEYLGHTEWYDFLRHMPSWKADYWISAYHEDSSSPVAIVTPQGDVYPEIERVYYHGSDPNFEGTFVEKLHLRVEGAHLPSEDDMEDVKDTFSHFVSIEWEEGEE